MSIPLPPPLRWRESHWRVPSQVRVNGPVQHPIPHNSPLVIWSINDGKAGHASQATGLTKAIGLRAKVQSHVVLAPPLMQSWCDLLLRRNSLGRDLPDPDLILGVGHRTHPAMLAARAARGGRAVVLMRPSLPLSMFDLVIVPEHDAPRVRDNVITTCGVLNSIRPSDTLQPGRGLILLGGPSHHANWSDEAIAAQVRQIVSASPEVTWSLTTSRRTPLTTAKVMRELMLANLHVTPADQTLPGWVADELAVCGQVWVSADSVSMVYEALTTGAAVGILDVLQRRYKRHTRVSAGLEELLTKGMVNSFTQWRKTGVLRPPRERLSEADRCAGLILREWLPRWDLG